MGKVYSAPAEIKKPEIGAFFSRKGEGPEAYFKAEEAYVAAVKAWAKANGKGKLAGEENRFQVADGYACYIVFSTTPVVLIHLATGDAWQYQYANRLTASDIKEEVRRNQAMAKLFGKKVEPFVPKSAVGV